MCWCTPELIGPSFVGVIAIAYISIHRYPQDNILVLYVLQILPMWVFHQTSQKIYVHPEPLGFLQLLSEPPMPTLHDSQL